MTVPIIEAIFFFILFYFLWWVFTAVLLRLAHYKLGDGEYWHGKFLRHPGIAHIECMLLLIFRNLYDVRLGWFDKDLEYLRQRSEYLGAIDQNEFGDGGSVTPFKKAVYYIWHDPKIEEYLEWNMPYKAQELAGKRLIVARNAGCSKSVKLYKSYISSIQVRIDSLGRKGYMIPRPPKHGHKVSSHTLKYRPKSGSKPPIRVK